MADDVELRGGLDLVHVPLFFLDLRVASASRGACKRIASELQVGAAENRLVTRRSRPLKDPDGRLARRVRRGEGGPLPSLWRGVFAAGEIACLWQLPSCEYSIVPVLRGSVPVAPAPPGVHRPSGGLGSLRDEYGPVSIEWSLRKQNTAVPGTVEQGKTSYLVATVAEDLERERCAVILFDPKGDAADAAVSLVDALADVHGARPRASHLRVQPARGRRSRRRDRRLRRRGAQEPVLGRRHPGVVGQVPAQRGDRRARLRPPLHAVGCRQAAVGRGGGLRIPQAGRRRRSDPSRVQRDQRLLHGRDRGPARGRAEHDHLEARRAGEQARSAAELAVDQAGAAQRVPACGLRPRDSRSRGAGRQGGARSDGSRQHLGLDAAAGGDARRGAGPPAGSRLLRSSGWRWR